MVYWFTICVLVLFALFNSLGVARNCSLISLVFDFYSSLPCSSLCCIVMSDGDGGAHPAKKQRTTLHGGSARDTARKQAVLDFVVKSAALEKRRS